jgi:hypothetical protein
MVSIEAHSFQESARNVFPVAQMHSTKWPFRDRVRTWKTLIHHCRSRGHEHGYQISWIWSAVVHSSPPVLVSVPTREAPVRFFIACSLTSPQLGATTTECNQHLLLCREIYQMTDDWYAIWTRTSIWAPVMPKLCCIADADFSGKFQFAVSSTDSITLSD